MSGNRFGGVYSDKMQSGFKSGSGPVGYGNSGVTKKNGGMPKSPGSKDLLGGVKMPNDIPSSKNSPYWE